MSFSFLEFGVRITFVVLMVQGWIFGIWIVLCIFVKFILASSFIVSLLRSKGFIALRSR